MNHSSSERATLVAEPLVWSETMDSYAARLTQAMLEARVHPQTLADHLELSIQAVRKVLGGGSAAFNVPNHFKACTFLRVNSNWLATGEGDMHSANVWPFVLITQKQIQKLSRENLRIVENLAIQILEAQSILIAPAPAQVNTVVKGSRELVIDKLGKDEEASGKSDRAKTKKRRAAGGG